MVSCVSKQNAIVLYWDLPEAYKKGDAFEVSIGEKSLGKTEKCHLEVKGLAPDTEYTFTLTGKDFKEEITAKTESLRRRINIADFGAVGDGKTLNTKAIQAAIDSSKAGECVYIPEGDFMTGSLFLHSDMELYLEKGAILHGTANVHDYEPKIKSRELYL